MGDKSNSGPTLRRRKKKKTQLIVLSKGIYDFFFSNKYVELIESIYGKSARLIELIEGQPFISDKSSLPAFLREKQCDGLL